jgi:hypothetical protein
MNRISLLLTLALLASLSACDLLDPSRPIQHPDTEIFGNLMDVVPVADAEASWSVSVRVGMPKAFVKAEEAEGKPTPALEKGIAADILVTRDTVVLIDGKPASIEDIALGSEVTVLPVAGSTRMMGTSQVTAAAAYLIDFESYRRWKLPRLLVDEDFDSPRSDPARINSDGVEHVPLPLAGGRVLYFAARMRPSPRSAGEWMGAPRPGLDSPAEGAPAAERSFRSELSADGWSPPEPVFFEGVDGAFRVVVSWVSPDETRCLVTVQDQNSSWIGSAERSSAGASWGSVERITKGDEDHTSDAVYLAGSQSKFVFSISHGAGAPGDLWLFDPNAEQTPLPLEPAVNTPGSEWGPRIGPGNELFFVRDDRQLLFAGGALNAVRVPGPHRTVITEAAPTDDGRWVFLCIPHYRPVDLDQDIFVAEWLSEGELGEPVPVDDWRP